ncbi:MAG: NIPSNAP family containing protein [Bacteroidetes bacterium]|nr:NIPSNAP family containing protein [Bacteroidota bacterium]
MKTSEKPMALLLLLMVVCGLTSSCDTREECDYFEMKIYRYETASQEERLDDYFGSAYLPALHRTGIENVGVFKLKEDGNEIQNAIILLIPFTSLDQYIEAPELLRSDQVYLEAGRDYIESPHNDPPYTRIESIILKAFSATPHLTVPQFESPREERVYELRSYQGATELLYERKVEMFNSGESELFIKLGFNPLFFGEGISSSEMPHLMYMISFSDTLSQKEHWAAFREHPDWQKMKKIDRYKNTVSNITKYMLYPTFYSDY